MTEQEQDKIIDNAKQKWLPSKSTQIYHCGVIVLSSLVLGIFIFRFQEISPDLKPEDLSLLRQGFGLWLGLFIAIIVLFLYLAWTIGRGFKMKKEVAIELAKAAINALKK